MGLFSRSNTVTAQEVHEQMVGGGKFILLDVRSPGEYRQIRIPGAKLIPLDQIPSRAAPELPNRDATIYVYCHSGARASSAVRLLTGMGYTNVSNLGGIITWPYETEKG